MIEHQPAPARPAKVRAQIEQIGDTLIVHYRRRQWGGGAFVMLWLIGWTVGCVFLAGAVIVKREWFMLVFGIPFWAAWFFVLAMLMSMLFRREKLVLEPAGATYTCWVLIPIQSRTIPLEELKSFGDYDKVVESESGRSESGLELVNTGRPLRIMAGLSSAELAWLNHQLNAHADGLRTDSLRAASEIVDRADRHPPAADRGGELVEALRPEREAPQPPRDCEWEREDDFESFSFLNRGSFSLSALLGLLFINAFWNGIVSVFVLTLWGVAPVENPPQGAMWWGMFVFLIPFECIGLVMFGGLVLVLLEPIRRSRWRMLRNEVELRHSWLGLGRSWRWPVVQLDRIELRREDPDKGKTNQRISPRLRRAADDAGYRLSLVTRENQELCTVDFLSEGEARWIGHAILTERRRWFD